jgi:hypothetical protein
MVAQERNMREIILLIIACIFSALVPFFNPLPVPQNNSTFPGWPTSFDGTPITLLPSTEREKSFEQDFPGKTGRFSDGKREIIIRWVTRETRTLHPAADCFRGIGYHVATSQLIRDTRNRVWNTFTAKKNDESLQVQEIIIDNDGNSWSDVSNWYWEATFQHTRGPWWAFTIAKRID